MNNTPIYEHDATYAREHGELEQYRESAKATRECRTLVDDLIRQNFDGLHLHEKAILEPLKQYPAERIALVLALTINERVGDGRFSASNRQWAQEITTEDEPHYGSTLTAHSYVLNGFVNMFRLLTEPYEEKPCAINAMSAAGR